MHIDERTLEVHGNIAKLEGKKRSPNFNAISSETSSMVLHIICPREKNLFL